MPSKFVTLEVYRQKSGGQPFLKKGLLLSEIEINDSIKHLIRRTLERNKPAYKYTEKDIVSVKTACGTDLDFNILDEHVSVLDHYLEGGAKWHLIVRILSNTSSNNTDGANDSFSIFNVMARSNNKGYVSSKHTKFEVEQFLEGFNNCPTFAEKRRYLTQMGSKRITVDEQVKALVCHFLKEHKLGVIESDTTAMITCKSAVQKVVQRLLFVRKHLGSLRVNNESVISNNVLFSQLQFCVSTSIKDIGIKTKSTTVAELTQFLESIEKESKLNKRCWPGTFYKKKKNDALTFIGQPIFDLESQMHALVLRTRQRLNNQASRTAIRTASETGTTTPTLANTGYEIRRTKR